MELWTAFLLGLLGSLHCAGMCGPLALAIPAAGNTKAAFVLDRLAYNFGRIFTYGLLGAIFGLIGKSFAVIGFQRWISLGVGILLLSAFLFSTRFMLNTKIANTVGLLKSAFAKLLHHRKFSSTALLGVLNGFLPCGLVYAACAGATVSSGFAPGIVYMIVFGLGTIPMMLAIGLAGKKLQLALRFKFQRLIPMTLVLMSVLLILRGLELGIPYLSPDLMQGNCCHR